jgi:hypothetical protein
MDMDKVDVMTETIKMRNTVKPLLGGKGVPIRAMGPRAVTYSKS